MRYVFRADASKAIGSGHVMRSSAIAEELIALGEEVVFVGQIKNLTWVTDRIEAIGFTEIHQIQTNFIPQEDSDVLILDSYTISKDDPFIAPINWFRIVVIADELTPDYRCSLKMHPGLNPDWESDSTTPILAGPRYIPFRKSLVNYKMQTHSDNKVLNIAVVAGGSDPYNLVTEIAKILHAFTHDFKVLLFSNLNTEEIRDSRFRYIEIGPELDELTQNTDLILTTASTSSFEFIARGFCVGVACAVENQQQTYDSLGKLGAAAQIGFRKSSNKWLIDHLEIRNLVESSAYRSEIISNSTGLIDFSGANRIAEAIRTL